MSVMREAPLREDTPAEYREEYDREWRVDVAFVTAEVEVVKLTGGNFFASGETGHLRIKADHKSKRDGHLCKEYGSNRSWSRAIMAYFGLRPVELGALPGKQLPVVAEEEYSPNAGWRSLDKATIAYGAVLNGLEAFEP